MKKGKEPAGEEEFFCRGSDQSITLLAFRVMIRPVRDFDWMNLQRGYCKRTCELKCRLRPSLSYQINNHRLRKS